MNMPKCKNQSGKLFLVESMIIKPNVRISLTWLGYLVPERYQPILKPEFMKFLYDIY